MNRVISKFILVLTFALSVKAFDQNQDWENAKTFYDFSAYDIHGSPVELKKYEGKLLVVVNVASQCGLAKRNYIQLQNLYEKYESRGLKVLAFPSNEFNGGEPGSSEEILEFIKRYKVTFDIFDKILINGNSAHPLFKWLKIQQLPDGENGNDIEWNFAKFVVGKDGIPLKRYHSNQNPDTMEEYLLTKL